jgi:replication factor C subunit 3/5
MSANTKYSLPWIEKYRPSSLDEMIDHREKINTLRSLIEKNEMTHLLFYGPPGCGKTSMIIACAVEMYGQQYKKYILELNASDDRGIETVRKKIPDFVKTASNKIRLVILDEADAMTNDAQSALRRVIEKYSKNSRFCLICNNINKIIPGIASRCTKMRFGYLDPDQIKSKLHDIIKNENVCIDPVALERVINVNRDFRQILNTLQCLHAIKSTSNSTSELTYNPITPDEINEHLGIPTSKQLDEILEILLKSDLYTACHQINDLFKNNQWNLSDLIHYLADYVVSHSTMLTRQKYFLIDRLSDTEVKLSHSNDAEVQLYALVSGFQQSLTITNTESKC